VAVVVAAAAAVVSVAAAVVVAVAAWAVAVAAAVIVASVARPAGRTFSFHRTFGNIESLLLCTTRFF
jgi:hypothetical protein